MNVSGIWHNITTFLKPEVRENRTTETDKKANDIAPERIKRSPGRQNIAEMADEPEWYHD